VSYMSCVGKDTCHDYMSWHSDKQMDGERLRDEKDGAVQSL